MAETRNEAERLAAKRQAEYMGRVDKRERTKEFGRSKPDHGTKGNRSPSLRRRASDAPREEKEVADARARQDEFAAEQAMGESRDVVVIPDEEEYDYDRAIPYDVVYGEWNIDNLGADFDGGGFEDSETQGEYIQYRSDLEYIRQQRMAREMNDRSSPSNARGKVRKVFRGEIQR